jgi:hypothetical protein
MFLTSSVDWKSLGTNKRLWLTEREPRDVHFKKMATFIRLLVRLILTITWSGGLALSSIGTGVSDALDAKTWGRELWNQARFVAPASRMVGFESGPGGQWRTGNLSMWMVNLGQSTATSAFHSEAFSRLAPHNQQTVVDDNC